MQLKILEQRVFCLSTLSAEQFHWIEVKCEKPGENCHKMIDY